MEPGYQRFSRRIGGTTARPLVDAELVHPRFAEGLQSVLMKIHRFALK